MILWLSKVLGGRRQPIHEVLGVLVPWKGDTTRVVVGIEYIELRVPSSDSTCERVVHSLFEWFTLVQDAAILVGRTDFHDFHWWSDLADVTGMWCSPSCTKASLEHARDVVLAARMAEDLGLDTGRCPEITAALGKWLEDPKGTPPPPGSVDPMHYPDRLWRIDVEDLEAWAKRNSSSP